MYGTKWRFKTCTLVSNFLHYLNPKHLYVLHMVYIKIEAKSIIVVFKRYLHFFLSLSVSSCFVRVCAWMCKLCLIWRNIFSSLNLRMCEIESLDFMHESDCRVLLKYMQCKICHPPFCFHICTIKWNKKHFVLRRK